MRIFELIEFAKMIIMSIYFQSAMTYEPGVLVRRQQREYPPELRQEIALAALEVGNNREVAR